MILQKKISFLLTFLCSLTLLLNLQLPLQAQIPLLSPLSTEDAISQLPQTPAWDLNRAEPCGRFLCSRVFFFGDGDLLGDRIILAIPRDRTRNVREVALEVEQRARFVQNIFIGIFQNLQDVVKNDPIQERKKTRYWLITHENPPHPKTPKVEIGIENGQTVLFIGRQEELGILQQVILTVTEVDANANAMTVEQLAKNWRKKIQISLSNALWGLEMDYQRPLLRVYTSIWVVVVAIVLILSEKQINKLLKKWKKNLEHQLEEIYESLKIDPETISIKKNKNNVFTTDLEDNLEKKSDQLDFSFMQKLLTKGIRNSKQVIAGGMFLSAKLLPDIFRQKQNLIRQQINLIELASNLLFLNQITIVFLAITIITITFRETRFLFNLFFTQALLIPSIWILMVFLDKIIDFWIDSSLNEWAKAKQELNPQSNRPMLRVKTYSPALTGATTVFFGIVGIFLTLGVIGLDINILAGAGVLAVAFAFLSRNLLEDLLNGILILATDRYVVGDVVQVDQFAGLVESMNLYTTSLRNLDGQLIVIPNSKITTVINMTKNWSRVNFTIKVSWDADLQKTMNILKSVGDQMYKEPEWQEKMFDTAEILGIDEIDHKGVLIRVLIKTLPLQQWIVGREYRWRVKQAFQMQGISLGIPQNQIFYKNNE
ncbi:MAG: mechanosensitive ion channel family protein [Geminocystis sp. GBBB08]|nr:mechanosensitive ion channel family protein [Geminocystis sp. GBBB08]